MADFGLRGDVDNLCHLPNQAGVGKVLRAVSGAHGGVYIDIEVCLMQHCVIFRCIAFRANLCRIHSFHATLPQA